MEEASATSWSKPPTGILKCNVRSAWSAANGNGGASWITRDSYGNAMLHSIRSQMEDEINAMVWAVETINNLRLPRIIIEVSTAQIPITLSQDCLPFILRPQEWRLRRALDQMGDCRLVLTTIEGNKVATKIAESALFLQHHQSYMATNGPGWLDSHIRREASDVA